MCPFHVQADVAMKNGVNNKESDTCQNKGLRGCEEDPTAGENQRSI
jgi:hypothetical protein